MVQTVRALRNTISLYNSERRQIQYELIFIYNYYYDTKMGQPINFNLHLPSRNIFLPGHFASALFVTEIGWIS